MIKFFLTLESSEHAVWWVDHVRGKDKNAHPHLIMSFCDSAKRYASAITLLSASIISITFSAWQFQIDAGDMKWHKKNWDDICTSFPINMLRRK